MVATIAMIVATWNLENLFPPGGEYGPTSEEAYEAKPAALAAVIADVDPDVLAVQEVGSPEAIRDLAGRLPGDGASWSTTCCSATRSCAASCGPTRPRRHPPRSPSSRGSGATRAAPTTGRCSPSSTSDPRGKRP